MNPRRAATAGPAHGARQEGSPEGQGAHATLCPRLVRGGPSRRGALVRSLAGSPHPAASRGRLRPLHAVPAPPSGGRKFADTLPGGHLRPGPLGQPAQLHTTHSNLAGTPEGSRAAAPRGLCPEQRGQEFRDPPTPEPKSPWLPLSGQERGAAPWTTRTRTHTRVGLAVLTHTSQPEKPTERGLEPQPAHSGHHSPRRRCYKTWCGACGSGGRACGAGRAPCRGTAAGAGSARVHSSPGRRRDSAPRSGRRQRRGAPGTSARRAGGRGFWSGICGGAAPCGTGSAVSGRAPGCRTSASSIGSSGTGLARGSGTAYSGASRLGHRAAARHSCPSETPTVLLGGPSQGL